jgi:hypothetical protein
MTANTAVEFIRGLFNCILPRHGEVKLIKNVTQLLANRGLSIAYSGSWLVGGGSIASIE